jgi:hypothetical protein
MVRPGLQRVFAHPSLPRPLTLVFDLNHVLAVKWQDPAFRYRPRVHCDVRVGPMAFLIRPGARKLLNMLRAAGHRVVIWSTMQEGTVAAIVALLAPWAETRCGRDCEPGGVKNLEALGSPLAHTLLIDDDPAKARLQPQCHVPVPPWNPESPWDERAVADRGVVRMMEQIVKKAL